MKQRLSLESLKHRQAFLKALLFFFVTIIIWIGFTLFRSQSTTKLPTDLTILALPLNPNIDIEVVERITKKRNPLQEISVEKVVNTAPSIQSTDKTQ